MTLPDWFPKRLLVYALVGATGTICHYLLFLALLAVDVPVLTSSILGYVLGAVVNYGLNYRITFASARRHRDAAPRFFSVALAGLVLNIAVVWLMHDVARLHPLVSQGAATALCLLTTYAVNSRWSFGETTSTTL